MSSLPDVYVPFEEDKHGADKPEKRPAWNHQVKSFFLMAAPYFRESPASRWILAGILMLALLSSFVRVLFSFLMRDFWSALADKQVDEFYGVLWKFLLALLVLVPINVFYAYQRQRLAIFWREWMTDRTLELYYANQVYYKLERSHQTTMDNVDQRIQEDVRSFTVFSLSFFLILLNSFIDLVAFSVILFSIRPQLFLAIVGFALFGSVTTWIIGRKLILLNFEKLKREATFRFSLVRLRENAESIAFLRGEATEAKTVNDRFQKVVANMHDINVAERNLDFFTTLYNYTVWILPVVVVAPEYFAGGVALGVVQQATNAFSHVLEDVSVIINQFESLSEFAAGIDRLFQFYIAIRAADLHRQESAPLMTKLANENNHDGDIESGIGALHDEQTIVLRQMGPKSQYDATQARMALSVQDLSLFTPDDKRLLFSRLSFSVPWGQRVLIVGNSGIGKSSLLRAVAGLWTSGTGMIERPHDSDVYFLPQRPYCALGSLRDQLLYPRLASNNVGDESRYEEHVVIDGTQWQNVSDNELLEVLKAVDLYDIATRSGGGDALLGLNAETDWSSILSLGEQQRLAFGRLLVNRPSFVILDESTSALDVASESRMYSLLRTRNVTYMSVGHRPSLEAYHDCKLTLIGGDSFSVENIR